MSSKLDNLINRLELKSSNLLTKINENSRLITTLSSLNYSISESDLKITQINESIMIKNSYLQKLTNLNIKTRFLEDQIESFDEFSRESNSWSLESNLITTENTLENLKLEYAFLSEKLSSFNIARHVPTPMTLHNPFNLSNDSSDSITQQYVHHTPSQIKESVILKPLKCQSTKVYKKKSKYRLSNIYNLNPINLSTPTAPAFTGLDTPLVDQVLENENIVGMNEEFKFDFDSTSNTNLKRSSSVPKTAYDDNSSSAKDENSKEANYMSLLNKHFEENDSGYKGLKHFISYDSYPRLKNPPDLKLNYTVSFEDDINSVSALNSSDDLVGVDEYSELESLYSNLSINNDTNTTHNSIMNEAMKHHKISLKRLNENSADEHEKKKLQAQKFHNPLKVMNKGPIVQVSNDLIYCEKFTLNSLDLNRFSFTFNHKKLGGVDSRLLLNNVVKSDSLKRNSVLLKAATDPPLFSKGKVLDNLNSSTNSLRERHVFQKPQFLFSQSKYSISSSVSPTIVNISRSATNLESSTIIANKLFKEESPTLTSSIATSFSQQSTLNSSVLPLIAPSSQWSDLFKFPKLTLDIEPVSEIGRPNLHHRNSSSARKITPQDYDPIKGSHSKLIINRDSKLIIRRGDMSEYTRPLVSKISYGALKDALTNDFEF